MSKLILFIYSMFSIIVIFVLTTFFINNQGQTPVTIQQLSTVENNPASISSSSPERTIPTLSAGSSEQVVVSNVSSGGLNLTFGSLPGTGSFFAGVKGTKAKNVELTVLRNPSRVVLDLIGDTSGVNEVINFNTSILKQIRSGRHKNKTRLVFDVSDLVSEDNLSLEFSNGNAILVVIK